MTMILVGVDDSDRARDAIAFARELARASGAQVTVGTTFHSSDRPGPMLDAGRRGELEAEAEALVARMAEALGDLGDDRVRTAVIARSSPAHGLQDLAADVGAQLVVVGSSHVSAAGRVLPGSTAERLLHGSHVPVAVVPRDHRLAGAGGIRAVGVAHDGSHEADAALRAAVEVARATGGSLRVISVLDSADFAVPVALGSPAYADLQGDLEREARADLDETIAELPDDVAAEAEFSTGDPVAQVARQTESLDLLVTGSRGYGPLRAVLLGGFTGRLLRDAACPVLVVPRGVEAPLGELFARRAA